MKRAAAFLLIIGVLVPSARAQAPAKVFVASTGNDANDGSRASPKRSFQAAHDAVATAGNIVVLDTAGYGTLYINKSVAITVPPGVTGFSTGSGITVNAGPASTVSLSGLIVEGPGPQSGGIGIAVNSVGTMIVENCLVRNFGNGITLGVTVNGRPVVRGGAIENSSSGISSIAYAPGVAAEVVATDVAIDGAATSAFYVYSSSASSTAKLFATRCNVTNSNAAFRTDSNTSTLVANECTVSGSTYVYNKPANSGAMYTRSNNTFYNNANLINGANTVSSYPAQ